MHWRGVEISETWVQRFVRLQWKIFEISETRGIPCYLLATLNFLRQPGVIREQNLGIHGQRHGAVRSVSQIRWSGKNFVRQKVRTDS